MALEAGSKSKSKVLADLVSSEVSLLGLLITTFSLSSHGCPLVYVICVVISSF